MYKVEIVTQQKNISELNNTQLLFTYIYINRTFKYLYHKKLSLLSKRQKKAIIYDLTLFEKLKQKRYSLRCCTPQKWLENWDVFQTLSSEMEKRQLSKNMLEFY